MVSTLIPYAEKVYSMFMTTHMMKLVVGADSIADFVRWQKTHYVTIEGVPYHVVNTRFMPKRADEIIRTGGSIYRVIKGRVCCRQRIAGFEMVGDENDPKNRHCLILTETDIIETLSMPHRPFQGWRYLSAEKAPPDKGLYTGEEEADNMPEEMAEELRMIGLL
jgi:hypothetical protein